MAAELTTPAPRRSRLSDETRHTLVGAAVMAVLATLFVLSAGPGGGTSGSYTLIARFASAEGIYLDSPVRLAGVDIGRVTGMAYESATQRTVLSLEIGPGIELPEDSIAIVTSEGMLGGRFVRIDPGGALDPLRDGDAIEYTQGSILFEELLAKVIVAVERKRLARRAAEGSDATPGAPGTADP
ncbi:MAG: MCE family protein [Rhodospirillales bacterium]|nr:MAG: MCE family protein [Rhodospirillales bacterium]